MNEFQRKRNRGRFLYSRITLLVLLIVLAFLFKALWGAYGRERENTAKLERVQETFAALAARAAALEEKLARLKTPEGIEAEIREQFQVAKPGEKMVVVIPDKSRGEEDVSEPNQSFVSKLFNIFR